jgi:hypothetical protein
MLTSAPRQATLTLRTNIARGSSWRFLFSPDLASSHFPIELALNSAIAKTEMIGLRLRQQLRLMVPISGTAWQAVAWSEGFFNVNDTDWGAQAGIDRWRNLAGINIPVREGMTLEPGYVNQYVNRTATGQVDHIVSVTVNMNF